MLVIDVDDRRDELLAALSSRGIEATLDGTSIAVQQEHDEQYDEIRDALVEVGARLRRLGPRRQQLTDIFRDNE